MENEQNQPHLDAKEIQDNVFKRLEKYKGLNFLEQFSMFMGVAQVLEIGLKNLLVRKYGYEIKKLERFTLGRTTRELKKAGLRADFVALLDSVVQYRNYIAHELLANDAMLRSILDGDSGHLETRQLEKGIYELEQVAFLYDWCEENDAWD